MDFNSAKNSVNDAPNSWHTREWAHAEAHTVELHEGDARR